MFRAFPDLRHLLYANDLGTWHSLRIQIEPPDNLKGAYNFDVDPMGDPPLPFHTYLEDLARYPRSAANVPRWMISQLAPGQTLPDLPSGITVAEGEPWQESGRHCGRRSGRWWRRRQATFPAQIDTHCRHRTFYVDADGLIRRHDFVAESGGTWAKAAFYGDRHRRVNGLVIPSRRRVFPRGPGGRAVSRPTFLALDVDEIEVGW